jgi:aminopeptidase N
MSFPSLRIVVTLAAVLAVTGAAGAEAPFDFDTAPGHLPKTVVPIDYQVAIVPDAATKTLTGTEQISVRVRQPVHTIKLNSLNEHLRDVKLDSVAALSVQSDDATQITTLTFPRDATVGMHTLTFSYDGKIETAPQGLFAQSYRAPGGVSGVMLSTQFEATDARRMFPCWDEPAFRATFQLTATVPTAWTSVSNMPIESRVEHGALATTTFRRSPKMPSYLVEYSAGDLAHVDADAGGKHFAIWAIRGQEQNGAYALANAQQILADYNTYFGYTFPLPKLDSIAVPGGFQGAMENWGAITYNDQALLMPPGSPLSREQRVFSIQAHEMAHQWNGDLVTMGWWDDIWLNESFASWMAAKETALRNPTWQWWERQDSSKETAMNADARLTSHAIEQHVVNELDAQASFDSAITYDKGQAFLRMLEAYLGPDTFRAGIRQYVQARAYSNATSADLWKALSAASNRDVAKLASAWTEQPGFPVVTVHATCDASGNRTIALSQKRFLLAGTDPNNERWSIPMDVRSGANGTPAAILLTTDGQTAPAGRCGEPLSVNADTVGFYRVAYDDATLAVDQKNFAAIPDGDKIALLDDQWALAAANAAPLSSFLAFTSSMGSDLDSRAWDQIIGSLATIEEYERGTPGHDAFVAYARAVVRPLFDKLGWTGQTNENAPIQALRRTAIERLGSWGDPVVVAGARTRFAAFMQNRSSLTLDDQGIVLPIVAENADAATFEQLHTLAKSAHDEGEARVYYSALLSVRDPQLFQTALNILMSNELPPQAAGIRGRLVLAGAGYNPQIAWAFYQAHSDQLLGATSEFSRALSMTAVPSTFWRAAPLDQLEAYVRAHTPATAGVYIARGMERARFALVLRDRLVPAADAYVAGHHT